MRITNKLDKLLAEYATWIYRLQHSMSEHYRDEAKRNLKILRAVIVQAAQEEE